MSLPLNPDQPQVRVTSPVAAEADTGRPAALTAAASAVAAAAAVAPLLMVARTRRPATYRLIWPPAVAVPAKATLPDAFVPVDLTGRHHTSPAGSMPRQVSYISASIEPAPPMLLARLRLGTSVSLSISGATASSLTWPTIRRGIALVAVLA
ncbi:hypothetical protein D3C76_1413580 [compost metagenome]